MNRIVLILVGIGALIVIGGLATLAVWTIPAPSTKVEKVIPNDRFAH